MSGCAIRAVETVMSSEAAWAIDSAYSATVPSQKGATCGYRILSVPPCVRWLVRVNDGMAVLMEAYGKENLWWGDSD